MEVRDILAANPHWSNSNGLTAIFRRSERFRRPLFKVVERWLNEPEIIAIHGLRRTGKTVLLHQLAEEHISRTKIPDKQVLFYSFESDDVLEPLPEEELTGLLNYYFTQILSQPYPAMLPPTLLVFDEIQNVQNWSKVLKRFLDQSHNLKILLSGSASLFIESESESLAGRLVEFMLPTLSFAEFCALQEDKISEVTPAIASISELTTYTAKPYTAEMQKLFEAFLLCGGFPQSAVQYRNGFAIQEIQSYIREQIIKKIITRDFKRYYGISNTLKDWSLAIVLADETGRTINVTRLSSDVGYSEVILSQHLEIFQQSFLISRIDKFDTQKRRCLSGKYKLYFRAPSIVMSLLGIDNLANPNLLGRIVETYVAERLIGLNARKASSLFYAQDKTNREIDFYIPDAKLVIEVKSSQNKKNSQDLDLKFFYETAQVFNLQSLIVTMSGHEFVTPGSLTTWPMRELPAWAL